MNPFARFRRRSYAPLPPALAGAGRRMDDHTYVTTVLDRAQVALRAEIEVQRADIAAREQFESLKRFVDARDAARNGTARRRQNGRFMSAAQVAEQDAALGQAQAVGSCGLICQQAAVCVDKGAHPWTECG